MNRLRKQILILLIPVVLCALFNLSVYRLLTCRLSNNFSSAAQVQMIDVGRYLPHTEGSDLPDVGASLKLSGDLPVLDGAAALVPVYAAVIDNIYPEGCVTYEGGVFSSDNYYGENFAPDSVMQYHNTIRGFRAVVDGTTDVFFTASPSEEQKAYAAEQGVELVCVPVGLEGFVFFVNAENPVQSLTVEEIRKIYAGEITNWSQVGGPDRIINPVTRLENSGSQTAFEAFMKDRKIGRKSIFAITGGSIGFSFRYYMEGIVDNRSVRMLALNGVTPTAEHIRDGSYPIVARFYAVYRADNENPNIPVLIDWLLSGEGQELIEKTGYVAVG